MDSYPGSVDTADWLDRYMQTNDGSAMSEVSSHDRTGALCSSDESEEKAGEMSQTRAGSKPHSTPQTLKWLEDNYEIAEGVCIPRSTLYYHYLEFCDVNDTQPVNPASFGKIIRQQFPQITTRRLGTRGQSKYHYYGIGVKETSSYYDIMYSSKGVESAGEGKKESPKQGPDPHTVWNNAALLRAPQWSYLTFLVEPPPAPLVPLWSYINPCDVKAAEAPPEKGAKTPSNTTHLVAYSPRSKLGTLLPEFPDIKDIKMPPGMEEGKVLTFLVMYRTHCQRILDTVIIANFDEVQSFLLHFWQGMPPHIIPILSSSTIIMLVGVCDSILYSAITTVLMPSIQQALPDSLTQVIRNFTKQLDMWLKNALYSLPEGLQDMKFDLARRFTQVLRRQTSLNHLCQAARSVLQNLETSRQLLDDWLMVDINSIVKQTLYTMDQYKPRDHAFIVSLCREFEHLLEEQATIDAIIEWLDRMIDKCVIKPASKTTKSVRQLARQFLLMWTCFGTRVIRDMTLHNAPNFGSFHLVHLMLDDYVLYKIEELHSKERVADFLRLIRGEESQEMDEVILPDSKALQDNLKPLVNLSSQCCSQQNQHQQVQQQQQPAGMYQDRRTVIATNSSVLHGLQLQDYDSQTEGYSTDESGSLEQVPSPTGPVGDLAPASTLATISAPVPTQHAADMSGYNNNGYQTHYGGQYKQSTLLPSTITATSHSYHLHTPSSSMLSQGLETQGRAPLIAHTGSLRATGSEWNVSQQPQQQQQGIMGNLSAGLRGAEALAYSYNPALRHTGYNATSYQYDVTSGSGSGMAASGGSGMTASGGSGMAASGGSGMYPGFSSDVFMTSGQGGDVINKRHYEEEQPYMRPCKRPNKEEFYFNEPNFTNIG